MKPRMTLAPPNGVMIMRGLERKAKWKDTMTETTASVAMAANKVVTVAKTAAAAINVAVATICGGEEGDGATINAAVAVNMATTTANVASAKNKATAAMKVAAAATKNFGDGDEGGGDLRR